MIFEVFGLQLNYFLVHTEIFSEYRKEKFLTKFFGPYWNVFQVQKRKIPKEGNFLGQ